MAAVRRAEISCPEIPDDSTVKDYLTVQPKRKSIMYTAAEKHWLKLKGQSDEQIAAAEAAGLPFMDLLTLLLNFAPMLIQMIQALINGLHTPKATA